MKNTNEGGDFRNGTELNATRKMVIGLYAMAEVAKDLAEDATDLGDDDLADDARGAQWAIETVVAKFNGLITMPLEKQQDEMLRVLLHLCGRFGNSGRKCPCDDADVEGPGQDTEGQDDHNADDCTVLALPAAIAERLKMGLPPPN